MKLFTKIAALFSPPPAPVVPPSPYSDAEFLEVVMQHARQKTQREQAARVAAITGPGQKLTD